MPVIRWGDVWEDPPRQVDFTLDSEAGIESNPEIPASLLADPVLQPQEAIVPEPLRRDESLKINEILELLETQLTSSELFRAPIEFKITGHIGRLPGKNYVRTM